MNSRRPVDHVRQQMESAAADAVRAYAARTRKRADQFAAVLEDIAENGLPSVEDCTPWEELREAHFARLAAQRPAGLFRPKERAGRTGGLGVPGESAGSGGGSSG